MIPIVVPVMIVIAPALAPYLFELLMTPVSLVTVLAVALPGDAQFFFSSMDAPFAAFVAVVTIGEGRHR
jgi:hypothetical protein